MTTTTKSKLSPETDAQRDVRILSNRACAAQNALAAAQDSGTATEAQLDALEAAHHAAMVAWNQARIALATGQVA
jgi:hypothetical protein